MTESSENYSKEWMARPRSVFLARSDMLIVCSNPTVLNTWVCSRKYARSVVTNFLFCFFVIVARLRSRSMWARRACSARRRFRLAAGYGILVDVDSDEYCDHD